MSDRLLLAGFFLEMTTEEAPLLLLGLARVAPVAGDRPPASPQSARPLLGGKLFATVIVFTAVFLKVSFNTSRGLFFPEMRDVTSGTNADTKFLPTSLATGKTYFFIKGRATRPIRMANAPIPPDPNCLAGP